MLDNLIRNINLKSILNMPLNEEENGFIEFLNKYLLNLKKYISKSENNIYWYYGKSKKDIYFKYETYNKLFKVREDIWNAFSEGWDLDDSDIADLLTKTVIKNLNIEVEYFYGFRIPPIPHRIKLFSL